MRGVGSVVPGACMCVYVGAGEGLFKALNKAHVIEGMVRRGTMVRVGAGRSCPIIGVGVGNLTEAGYQRANQREGWGSLSAGRRRGLGNERQAWGMKTEGTVLLLRDGGVGREVLWRPFTAEVWIGAGSTRKGEKREGGRMVGKPRREERSGCHGSWHVLPFCVPWPLGCHGCVHVPTMGILVDRQASSWLLPDCPFLGPPLPHRLPRGWCWPALRRKPYV